MFFQPTLLRWATCAEDMCFNTRTAMQRALGAMFRAGRALPVDRKGGIWQQQLRLPVEKLGQG